MDLYSLTLGDREYEEKEILGLDETQTVVAKVIPYKNAVVFRAKPGYGPSTIDIVIPYGAPAYRVSERPLAGLALHEIYRAGSKEEPEEQLGKFLSQTKLLALFAGLSEKYATFKKAGMLAGQRMYSEASVTDRGCIIINDCIHLKPENPEKRVALVDLYFRSISEKSRVDTKALEQFVRSAIKESKNLSFLSVECRKYSDDRLLDKDEVQAIHLYLTVNLEDGFYDERQTWLSCCHGLYYQDFMMSGKDIINDENSMITCLNGGLYVVGEYHWVKQLKDIEPYNNTTYELTCEEFRKSKAAVQRIKDLGEHPGFVSMMRARDDQAPYQPTEADVKEARIMGW